MGQRRELLLLPSTALRELTGRTPDLAMALLADAGQFLRRLVGPAELAEG